MPRRYRVIIRPLSMGSLQRLLQNGHDSRRPGYSIGADDPGGPQDSHGGSQSGQEDGIVCVSLCINVLLNQGIWAQRLISSRAKLLSQEPVPDSGIVHERATYVLPPLLRQAHEPLTARPCLKLTAQGILQSLSCPPWLSRGSALSCAVMAHG